MHAWFVVKKSSTHMKNPDPVFDLTVGSSRISLTRPIPDTTSPTTRWVPSRSGAGAVVMANPVPLGSTPSWSYKKHIHAQPKMTACTLCPPKLPVHTSMHNKSTMVNYQSSANHVRSMLFLVYEVVKLQMWNPRRPDLLTDRLAGALSCTHLNCHQFTFHGHQSWLHLPKYMKHMHKFHSANMPQSTPFTACILWPEAPQPYIGTEWSCCCMADFVLGLRLKIWLPKQFQMSVLHSHLVLTWPSQTGLYEVYKEILLCLYSSITNYHRM